MGQGRPARASAGRLRSPGTPLPSPVPLFGIPHLPAALTRLRPSAFVLSTLLLLVNLFCSERLAFASQQPLSAAAAARDMRRAAASCILPSSHTLLPRVAFECCFYVLLYVLPLGVAFTCCLYVLPLRFVFRLCAPMCPSHPFKC